MIAALASPYRIPYTGNGAITQYAYTFRILASTHLGVYLNGVKQNTGFSISGVGEVGGGLVTFSVAPGSGVKITLTREVPNDQSHDYLDASSFPAQGHEDTVDKLTSLIQMLQEQLTRVPKFPIDISVIDPVLLPNVTGQFLKWDPAGNITSQGVGTADLSGLLSTGILNMDTFLLDALTAGAPGHSFPVIVLNNKDTATPNGAAGLIQFKSPSSTGVVRIGAQIKGGLLTATNGAEQGLAEISILRTGASDVALSIQGHVNGTRIISGPTNIVDVPIATSSNFLVSRTLNADANEFGISGLVNVPSFTGTASQLKAAIMGKIKTAKNSPGGNPFYDAVGNYGQGMIANGIGEGRVWGGVFEAMTESPTANGQLVGCEIGVINNGTDQININTTTSKYNLVLSGFASTVGDQPVTAAIWYNGIPGVIEWHYGMFMQDIDTEYIHMQAPPVGTTPIGILMQNSADWEAAIVLPNNKQISSFNAAGTVAKNLMYMSASDVLVLGDGLTSLTLLPGVLGNVSVGVADSGGAGFRVLRVPN